MNIEGQYLNLLQDILDNGVEKQDRTGTGTISAFGRQIRHDMSEGFPLLTTKKMYWKGIVTELLWFLRGDTNIKYLVDNDCHIWDGDCFANYMKEWSKCVPGDSKFKEGEFNSSQPYEASNFTKEEFINKIKTDNEFAKKWGELGPIYGKQWRKWKFTGNTTKTGPGKFDYTIKYEPLDQIQNLINDLKTNPDSRRLMVNAWNVGELDQMVLPPCHYGFQVYTRELTDDEKIIESRRRFGPTNNYDPEFVDVYKKERDDFINNRQIGISLMYNARSQDVPLGTPFNISSYALLLEIIAKMVNMIPDELISNMGDCHIYKDQIDGVKEQLTREPYPLPKLVISDDVNFNGTIDDFLNSCSISDLKIEGYQSHPPIKIPLSN
jgi:thymidylate synthase